MRRPVGPNRDGRPGRGRGVERTRTPIPGRGTGGPGGRPNPHLGRGEAGARPLTWTVEFSSRAVRDLKQLDRPTRARVVDAIERHASTGAGDIKRLRDRDAEWRLRVGDWRILISYRFGLRKVEILRVLHRKDAYR
ncbi:MAG: type II toxin-antitoxin system RelE/ParE family toxin [Acidobacteria bacterium]|nr:type II toxin-antitoxin system RelE/ParE family toxin [Acidobacteriota bacterium]